MLTEDQRAYVNTVSARCVEHLEALTPAERAIFTTIWTLMARTSAPVVVRSLHPSLEITHSALAKLTANGLLWFDNDLRAVLQCPPFSVLSTPHRVKAFGWDAAFACSFIDIPLALLLYGPNTWLSAQSVCPRSGEKLTFRVLMNDQHALKLDAPASASRWRIWLPDLPTGELTVGSSGARGRVNAFFSSADLDTYLHYHPTERGTRYTLEQSICISQALVQAYNAVLNRPH